jgi:hypothetical protein
MSIKRDYLFDQIEKFAHLLAILISGKKPDPKDITIDQALADLTGLPEDFFASVADTSILYSVLSMVPTDDQKALAAMILWYKNQNLYRETAGSLLAGVDRKKLETRVNEMLSVTGL